MIRLDTNQRLTALIALLAVGPLLAPVAAAGAGGATTADRPSVDGDAAASADVFVGEIEPGGYTDTTVTFSPGEESWNVSDVYVTGTDADAFSVESGGGSFTLAPDEERDIVIGFSADTLGTKNATLVIEEERGPIEVTLGGDVVESTSTNNCTVPKTATFGEVQVGNTVTRTVTVPGLEDRDLTVTASLIGPDADQFRIVDGGGTFTIPAGESHDITVAYTPDEAGTPAAQIELVPDDDSLERRCIDLEGEGVDDSSGGGGAIDVSLSTTALEFGEVPVGTTDQRTVTVTNDGSDPVLVAPGTPDAPFSVVNEAPTEVAPGESHEITVAFAPESEGSATGSLRIGVSNETTTVERVVDLSGAGAASESAIDVSLSTESVDFGVVHVDDVGSRTVTVTNEGNATVRIGAGITDGTFSVIDGGPADVAPGESREFTVEFPPRGGGPENGSMRILVQNGSDSVERTVALTGVGADPQIAVSVADDRLTVDDPETTVTVANDGEGPLIVDEFTLPGPFTADVETPLRVPAGEQRQVTVTFDTDADTNVTATLRIGSNDADDPVVRRTLRGVVESANATVAVDGRTSDDERTVNATVTDVEPGSTVGIDTGTGVNRSENVSVDEVAVTVEDGDPFSLNVTQSDDELDTSPTFNLSTGTEDVGYLRVNHTVPDADVESVSFTFTVPDERIPRNASTGELEPEDMSLYRYVDGEWVELETEPVQRLDGAWKFQAQSPGLSEFAIGRKEPQFEIDSAEINVSSARVGDDVAVRVLITNTGGADGIYDVQLFENGELVDRRRPTVPPNGTVRIVFLRSYEEAGDYRIDVNNRTIDTLSVEARDTETPTDTETSTDTEDPSGTTEPPAAAGPTGPDDGDGGDGGVPVLPLVAVGLLVTAGAGAVYRTMSGGGDAPPDDEGTVPDPDPESAAAGSAGAVELSGDDEWDEWDDWEEDDGDGEAPDGDAADGADDGGATDESEDGATADGPAEGAASADADAEAQADADEATATDASGEEPSGGADEDGTTDEPESADGDAVDDGPTDDAASADDETTED